MKKNSDYVITGRPIRYGNAGRAASQVRRAMGDHRFGVREVTDSKPGGTPLFEDVSIG